jgi:hypothetical protein
LPPARYPSRSRINAATYAARCSLSTTGPPQLDRTNRRRGDRFDPTPRRNYQTQS